MTDLLIKIFVKNYEDVKNVKVREKYGVLSSVVGIVCNILLFGVKFLIGSLANSISIISDGFNNLSDCASCFVTLFGYKLAAKPADKDHPFGHGRIEYLTSLVIAVAIMLVGFELFKSSVNAIINPSDVSFSVIALTTLIISILIKIWMGFFNRKMGNKIDSDVMRATAADSFSDVFATIATVIALVASIFTSAPVDGVMGIIVSILIFKAGYEIIKETVDKLLGGPADEALVNAIKEIVDDTPVALGMHDLIIHSYGPGYNIGSFHIEIDSNCDIMEVHDKIDDLERFIYDKLGVLITIHMDPVETNNEHVKMCKQMINEIVSNIDAKLSMHDFRVVAGPGHTNLIFDVVVPYDCSYSEDEIKLMIDKKLEGKDEVFYTVITFDKSFC